ncbi:MAG: cytochrome c-type biogenesis protein CcmH [Hyphomicrobiaceae bacterium]|nr:MAG: cytochrome c-type biogenesis protein CcmH [Hyphomicrobiaceae bacterium]
MATLLRIAATCFGVALLAVSAAAVEPDEILADAKLEARARAISAGLRCLVCQNQSIDDSNAPLARDLRILVRQRLKAGDSDAQVFAYVEGRYGKFVLLQPPLALSTIALWSTPLVLLALAGFALWRMRSSSPGIASSRLSGEEEDRLRALLGGDKKT